MYVTLWANDMLMVVCVHVIRVRRNSCVCTPSRMNGVKMWGFCILEMLLYYSDKLTDIHSATTHAISQWIECTFEDEWDNNNDMLLASFDVCNRKMCAIAWDLDLINGPILMHISHTQHTERSNMLFDVSAGGGRHSWLKHKLINWSLAAFVLFVILCVWERENKHI